MANAVKDTLDGKGVVITGGSRGLGLALALEAASRGAKICLIARDQKELNRAREIILSQFPQAEIHVISADVTERLKITAEFPRIVTLLGEIALWINNAGAILVGPMDSMVEEDFRAQMELHLFAVISTSRLVVDYFRKKEIPGRIVNISSLGGKITVPHMLTYTTSKFALAGFSQGLMAEVAKDKISVTTVYPTVVQTGSPIQAVFKGDHEKEFEWFQTSDVAPGASLRADKLAKQIIQAALDRKTELVPSFMGRLRIAAGILFPETMSKSNQVIAQGLPTGQSLQYKTGAQSKSDFEKSAAGKVLRKKAVSREVQYNQKEKSDPKFNLNLKKKKKRSVA